MAERKFVSISVSGSFESGYCLLAVASDGTAWASESLVNLGRGVQDAVNWFPVPNLPQPEKKASMLDAV